MHRHVENVPIPSVQGGATLMVAKPGHDFGIMRSQTKPGDVMIKLNRGGAISGFISLVSGGTEYVHGGIAVGDNKLVEVNGGLGRDQLGKNRVLANIYVTDLMKDLKDTAYDVWRCSNQTLAEEVAIQSYPFAAQGHKKSWGYDLIAALRSTGSGSSAKDKDATSVAAYIDANESILSVANMQKKTFFCTQFIAWMYYQAALKLRHDPPDQFIPIASKDAIPRALVNALESSPWFTYVGTIQRGKMPKF